MKNRPSFAYEYRILDWLIKFVIAAAVIPKIAQTKMIKAIQSSPIFEKIYARAVSPSPDPAYAKLPTPLTANDKIM